jgi:protein gp37
MVSDKFILQALAMMWNRRETTWLVLTKRAKRLYDVLAEYEIGLELAQHIWFGVTTENQEQYSERYEWLAQAPVALRWISVEPMLEAVCLADMQPDWVVCGGESGSNRRPFSLDWAKDLKRQCDERGITFFGKQGSGLYPGTRLSFDGRECKAWPR